MAYEFGPRDLADSGVARHRVKGVRKASRRWIHRSELWSGPLKAATNAHRRRIDRAYKALDIVAAETIELTLGKSTDVWAWD